MLVNFQQYLGASLLFSPNDQRNININQRLTKITSTLLGNATIAFPIRTSFSLQSPLLDKISPMSLHMHNE